MDKILVTGGAGYIGSHIIKNLLKEGFSVITLDNLSAGFIEPMEIIKKEMAPPAGGPASPAGGFEFIRGDLGDKELLEKIFHENQIETVMHLAAKIYVDESVRKPELYYQENFIKSVGLIEAMTKAGINKFIFSSSCVVYGRPQYIPIDEKHPTNPENPYGQAKLDFEKYLEKVENLQFIILRYFNVGGAEPTGLIGKSHLTSQDIMENIFKVALGQKKIFQFFGTDYPTPDGTAIRDYIHVEDISQAHILALEKLEKFSREVFNLGSETGFSVREVLDKTTLIIGREIPHEAGERRPGDTAISVASAAKAKEKLGWNPQYSDLEQIIRTDWNWRKKHPLGYTRINE